MKRLLTMTVVCAAAVACADTPTEESRLDHTAGLSSAAQAATPATATIVFGVNSHGSPFGPAEGHDASFNAKDNLIPRTVVIAVGGSVTFQVGAMHQAAVYEPGTAPEDITVSPATLEDVAPVPGVVFPDFRINDPDDRIVLGPPQSFAPVQQWTTPPGTFDAPGRYLVICTTTPHFVSAKMYGWVIVR